MIQAKTRTCLNPACGKKFVPRPNVPNQRVCPGGYRAKCGKKCPGASCRRCGGKGSSSRTCREWYREHWSRTAGPPRCVSAEDWTKIEKALPSAPPWLKCAVLVARDSGMRISELVGLTVGDVLDGRQPRKIIAIIGQWKAGRRQQTKTGESRTGFLMERARGAIAEFVKGRKSSPTDRLIPFSRGWVWGKWVEFQKRVGVAPETGDHYRFHDLRHTLGTELVRGGRADLAQKFLGHRNPSTTQRYNTPRLKDILADAEKIRRGK